MTLRFWRKRYVSLSAVQGFVDRAREIGQQEGYAVDYDAGLKEGFVRCLLARHEIELAGEGRGGDA